MTTPTRGPAALVAVLSLALIAACAPSPRSAATAAAPDDPVARMSRGYSDVVRRDLVALRAATARFAVLDSAVAAGYAPSVERCWGDAHQAMGFHHVNRTLVDRQVDVEHPEILLYERHPDGSYALNAVEYIVPYRLWPQDSVPPMAFGQSMVRADDLRIWSLHVWAWKENSAGLFAPWNTMVHCAA